MTVSSVVRKILGSATDPIIRWNRHWYIDLDDFGRTLSRFGPVTRALEIGCGDGHLTERLVAEMPEAEVLGIDIADDPGRLYKGAPARVTFRQTTAADLAQREPASFGLVVLCDVLHHVPVEQRDDLLAQARALVEPGGHLVVKDWIAVRNLASMGSWLSDRYITGDRIKFFPDRADFVRSVTQACAPIAIVTEGRVPPQRNNLYVALRVG